MRELLRLYSPRRFIRPLLWLIGLCLLTWLAALQCRVNLGVLLGGISNGVGKLALFLHPEWSTLPIMLKQAGITVAIALLSTPLAAAFSLVFGLAGARNLSPAWLRIPTRIGLGFERVLPDIFVLLMLVAALGLGVAPAIIALTVASLGMLGKLFADTLEEVDSRALEALRATGAGYGQVIRYAILPRILPSLISLTIFRFEVNIRAATILGAVAGQGIGYELYRSIGLLEYGRASMAIIVILLLVHLTERLTDFARRRILAQGKLK